MSKIAIKGHATRGNEVIALFEMMGGENVLDCSGHCIKYSYYVCDRTILCDDISNEDGEFEIFNLEEFLEKYPFKVGDKVKNIYGAYGKVYEMKWRDDKIQYRLDFGHHTSGWYSVCELQPYKEEVSMEDNKCTQCVYAVNNNHCGLRGFRSNFNVNYCSAQNIDKLPNGFELQEDGYFSWVNKGPKYPTTYKKCRAILDNYITSSISGYKAQLLVNLQKLLVCRDAYWKIAGEELELGKPWEPDLENEELYCIQNYNKQIIKSKTNTAFNKILIFPTEEMRDAFYDNFKDLIEQCKEYI